MRSKTNTSRFIASALLRVGQFARSYILGILAGAAVLFREPTVLVTLPLLWVGLRHTRGVIQLAGLAGVGMSCCFRAAMAYLLHGDPFFVKPAGFGFSIAALPGNLLLYLPFLVILLPGGLYALYCYRGQLFPGLSIGVTAYLILIFLYTYNGLAFSGLKGLVLGPRLLLPVVPPIIVCIAYIRFGQRLSTTLTTNLIRAGALSCCLFVFGVGYYYDAAQRAFFSQLQGSSASWVLDNQHTVAKVAHLLLATGARLLTEPLPPGRAYLLASSRSDTPAAAARNRRVRPDSPLVDQLLPDGTRLWQAILPDTLAR